MAGKLTSGVVRRAKFDAFLIKLNRTLRNRYEVMLKLIRYLSCFLVFLSFGLHPLQAGIVFTGEPELFTPSVQAQARRGRTGWEGRLATQNASMELDASGAPFWEPTQYYDFDLTVDADSGEASWWIDVDRDQSRSANETLAITDSALVGQSFNYLNLNLTGRARYSERAFVRNLSINGQPIGITFDSQFGVADFYFTDADGIDWTQMQVSGEIRLSWDTSTESGSQERPRVWLTVGNGSSAIPEPASLAVMIPFFAYLGLRRSNR